MYLKIIADLSCWQDAMVFRGKEGLGLVRKSWLSEYEYEIYAPLSKITKDSDPGGMIKFCLENDTLNLTHIFLYNKLVPRGTAYIQGQGFGELILKGLGALAKSLRLHKMQISNTANYLLCRLVYEKISSQAIYSISDISYIEEDINVFFPQYTWFVDDSFVELQLADHLCNKTLYYTFKHNTFIQNSFYPGSNYTLRLDKGHILVYRDLDNTLVSPQDILAVRFPNLNIDITWEI